MRVTLLTAGSRGDVQPYVALGLGLKAAGHSVRLATHPVFGPWLEGYGLEFFPVHGNPRELMESPGAQALLRDGASLASLERLTELGAPILRQFMEDSWAACQGTEAILFSALGFYGGYSIAEKLGVPACGAYLQPTLPTWEIESVFVPAPPPWLRPGRPLYNRVSHWLSLRIFWRLAREPIDVFRREVLGLPPFGRSGPFARMKREGFPIVFGYSPHVVPRPRDWPASVEVTGFWFLDAPPGWTPPEELESFLAAGPPPVYVGFGSMGMGDARALTALVLEALERAGQRAVLLRGWGGLVDRDLPPTVRLVESIPHEWLFPRVAAVVHHGGAGTTAAGLRAGVPSVLVPHIADQPFWGRRVAALGVGPRPLPRQTLTADALAEAIRTAVTDARLRERAARLGEAIRAEDGVARAVAFVERQVLRRATSRRPS